MLKVGAGIACINPTPDMYPLPLPKRQDWGIKPTETTGPYDDMNCRVIMIENERTKLLFIAYELSAVPKIPDLTQALSSVSGVPEDNIITLATTTIQACGMRTS